MNMVRVVPTVTRRVAPVGISDAQAVKEATERIVRTVGSTKDSRRDFRPLTASHQRRIPHLFM
jgi:hypothetical protein